MADRGNDDNRKDRQRKGGDNQGDMGGQGSGGWDSNMGSGDSMGGMGSDDTSSLDEEDARPNPIQIQKYLSGVDYPCSKDEIVDKATDEGADESILRTLERLERNQFTGPDDVSEALGELYNSR